MNYTRGEWKVAVAPDWKYEVKIWAEGPSRHVGVASVAKSDATGYHHKLETTQANAYLISAAPEMYEILCLFRLYYDRRETPNPALAYPLIVKALAKAEGRTQ